MCNVSIWQSGLLINAGRVGRQRIRLLHRAQWTKARRQKHQSMVSSVSPFLHHFLDKISTTGTVRLLLLDVMFIVRYLHILTSPLCEPAGGSDMPRWTYRTRPFNGGQTKPFILRNSSTQKSLNAADNCIEELSSQCLQPSTEGQLSQT